VIRWFLGAISLTILFILFLLLVRVQVEPPRRLILELKSPAEWLDLLQGKERRSTPLSREGISYPPEEKKPISSREYVRKILEERRKEEEERIRSSDRNELERLLKNLER